MLNLFQRITYVLLWLSIFTVPIQKHFIIAGFGSLNKIFGLALAVAVVYTVLLQKKIKRLPLFFIIGFVFIAFNIGSYFWAASPSYALDKSLLYLQLIFIAWTIYEFAGSNKKINNLLKAYILGCTLIALQTIYLFTTGNNQIIGSTRFFIEGYNPNALGILWTMALPMAIYLIVKGFKEYLLYIPIGMYVVFLTGSRTAFILLVVISVCSLWLLFKYRIKFRKSITLLLMILGFYVYSQVPQGQLDRISTIDEEFSGGSLNGRTDIWNYGIEAFSTSPIFGVGSGSFLEASTQFSTSGVGMSAHSSYLSVMAENGILGFLLFFGMISTLIITSYRIEKSNPARWLSLTMISAWLILSFVSHAEAQKYTWIVFGFILSLYYTTKEKSEVKKGKKPNRRRFKRYKVIW
ncbi:hypothetical protein CSV71_15025 [Sporosarcina sp. P21c]|uniref:O-antigen ligase family protein n=1 Tax=Sporosarcina sp. P21c TaxID=2048255 RepID=UPI000C16889A|nr:O-antigen ligase family protein [Sporosarcina sp. P21c]PIC88435.1 hypothetical protein CSV71_15025 [Sporosarcina sp. P21c]